MRILFLTNKPPFPPCDGGTIATWSLAVSFSNFGHQIDILSISTSKHFYNSSQYPHNIPKNITIHAVFVKTKINIFNAIINLFFSRIPYSASRFVSRALTKELIQLLVKNKYDIIQVEGLYMCQYIPIIRKFSKDKIAYRSHNIEHEIWKRVAENKKYGLKKIYLKILARRIRKLENKYLNKYDYLVPITGRDSDQYKIMGNQIPVKVIPAGIFVNDFKEKSINIEYPSVFYIGALDWLPNQEGLLWFLNMVWNYFINKYPNLKFYIAGRNAPKKIESVLNLKNIVYLGEIDNAHEFISSKAIMIVPLFSGSGMRVKIIEGMALGKAIVSTRIGVEGIKCTNGENILLADTPVEFVKQIEKLINNFSYFEKIINNAREFIFKNYDNQKIAKSLIDFYQNN